MASLNKKVPKMPTTYTHQGAVAAKLPAYTQLRRAVLATLLWEDSFYESGVSITQRISDLVKQVPLNKVLALANEARTKYRMRHAPLWLLVGALKNGSGTGSIASSIESCIQRADELSEILSMYWEGQPIRSVNGQQKCAPIPNQLKKALAKAFQKFDAYQLAKYDRAKQVRLADVMKLVHPKPKNAEQAAMWKALLNGTLPAPDTWEVALSSGKDKAQAFTDLLQANKLGYMALLRNLRNMSEAGVDKKLIRNAILSGAAKSKALPFRFFSAAQAAPDFEPELDTALQTALAEMPKLPGRTIILVDNSISMNAPVSNKSQVSRTAAAASLAAVAVGVCEDVSVYSFSDDCAKVPPRKGMALVDAVSKAVKVSGTATGEATKFVLNKEKNYDRIIIITDEQASPGALVKPDNAKGYILNIAGYQNSIADASKGWVSVTGFSEAAITFIREIEQEDE